MLKESDGPKPKIIAVLKAHHKAQFLCNPPVVITSQHSLLVFLSKMAEPTLHSTAVLSKCAILFPLPLLWRKLLSELNQDPIHQTRKKFQNSPKICNNQVKQPSAGAKEHQFATDIASVRRRGQRASPTGSQDLAAELTSSDLSTKLNTHRTPRQPHFPAKEEEKEGKEDEKHSHVFLSHLYSEADCSTLHTLTEQAAKQLGSCFFHTTGWNWNPKKFRNILCEEVCTGYSCSGRETYFALSPTYLGTDTLQIQITLTTGFLKKPAHKSWGSKPI